MSLLTSQMVEKLARDWYRKLDVHAPMLEIMPMLSARGNLEMVFPEATLKGLSAFEGWYQGVIRLFFDEVHTVKSVASEINGERARVKVVVRWEASRWRAPSATSERIKLDAYQTWDVELDKGSAGGERPVITKYTVDNLEYVEGSARL